MINPGRILLEAGDARSAAHVLRTAYDLPRADSAAANASGPPQSCLGEVD